MRKLSPIISVLASLRITLFILFFFLILTAAYGAGIYLDVEMLRQGTPGGDAVSKLFSAVLAAFMVNLFCCTVNRAPGTLKLLRKPAGLADVPAECTVTKVFTPPGDISACCEKLAALLAQRFKSRVATLPCGGGRLLFLHRGAWSHAGFYLAHVNILLIGMGLILSAKGYKAGVEISARQAFNPLVVVDGRGEKKALPFGLFCENGKAGLPAGPGSTDEQCVVTVVEGSQKIMTRSIDFGSPLHYRGYDIFKERFTKKARYARLSITAPSGNASVCDVREGGHFTPAGTETVIRAVRFRDDSVRLRIGSTPSTMLVTRSSGAFNASSLRGYRFALDGFVEKDVFILKVIRDPGKMLLGYGVLGMLAGFFITFFFRYQKVCAVIEQHPQHDTVTLAGWASKNSGDLQALFTDILQELK